MKVNIGPYVNWYGPHQLVKPLEYWGISEETLDRWAEKLPMWPFERIQNLRRRRAKIKIHKYDTWNMDRTLALIIHPMLLQLRANKPGMPAVEDDDVPERFNITPANDAEGDLFMQQRWDWVLNEMIFAFECLVDEDWEEDYFPPGKTPLIEEWKKVGLRIDNGLRLFGTYFQSLWE